MAKSQGRDTRFIFGFHAIQSRLRNDAESIHEIHVAEARQDARSRDLMALAESLGVRVIPTDTGRLDGMASGARHQGVVARVDAQHKVLKLEDVLETMNGTALMLVLDGVTDPHNLGACLRVADAAGAHAVIAPKDRSASLNATAIKVASGAADTVPYVTVTNLSRALRQMQDADIWIIGAAGEADQSLYDVDQTGPVAWVLGAEGSGLRRLTRDTCDVLAKIPMQGSVDSLNVSVATGVCLFEAVRQRVAGKR